VTDDPAAKDTEVRLQAVIDWLEHHRITTAQAAARVRAMHFPVPPPKTAHQRMEDDVTGDPEVPPPGSFFAISDAFTAGRIDQDQYAALAQAAADAMKRVPGT
jgi:hypothetical protein